MGTVVPAIDEPPPGESLPFLMLSKPEPAPPRGWHVDPGRYDIRVGRSASDIRHTVEVRVAAAG